MKYRIWIFALVVLVFAGGVFGQIWRDGKMIEDSTITGAKLEAGTVEGNIFSASDRLITGSEWFPVTGAQYDSTGSGTLFGVPNGGWDAMACGVDSGFNHLVFQFDADHGSTGDDSCQLTLVVPAGMTADSLYLDLYWRHEDDDGAAADTVTWTGSYRSIGEADSLTTKFTFTDLTGQVETCTASDSALYITTLSGFSVNAKELLTVRIKVDEDGSNLDSGETADLIGALVRWRGYILTY